MGCHYCHTLASSLAAHRQILMSVDKWKSIKVPRSKCSVCFIYSQFTVLAVRRSSFVVVCSCHQIKFTDSGNDDALHTATLRCHKPREMLSLWCEHSLCAEASYYWYYYQKGEWHQLFFPISKLLAHLRRRIGLHGQSFTAPQQHHR